MSRARTELEELAALLEEQNERKKYRKMDYAFPDDGTFARSNYPNHLRLFAAGKEYKERAFVAPNRVGKTYMASMELAYHATGIYPTWWEGHRFTKPISAWAIGKTNDTIKDILQLALLGPRNDEGCGSIPKHLLDPTPTTRPGIPGARQDIFIKHVSGGTSVIGLKSYEQGIDAFMGTAKDFIWMDEEPPQKIYTECLTRTATTCGLILATFTPLNGISEVFSMFVPDMQIPHNGIVPPKDGIGKSHKFTVGESWEHSLPHLPEEQKEILKASYAPWELSARTQGIPSIGSGAVYPIAEEDITCSPFDIPPHWPRLYGLDVGYKRTAAVWLAYDLQNDTFYAYDEYVRGSVENAIHIAAIKARGEWIPGVVDTLANTSSRTDGENQYTQLLEAGLNLRLATKSVVAGVCEVMGRLSSGRLKLFNTLQQTLSEKRMYRYNEDGDIIKKMDDLMDALRYALFVGKDTAEIRPDRDDRERDVFGEFFEGSRNMTTGY